MIRFEKHRMSSKEKRNGTWEWWEKSRKIKSVKLDFIFCILVKVL